MLVLLGGCQTGMSGNSGSVTPGDSDSALIAVYRGPLNHLSAVRRGSCPMHPSCSEYARLALAAHGPIKGWILAMDRLLRCGRDETRYAPIIYIDGQPKFHDPLPQGEQRAAEPEPMAAKNGEASL